MIRNTRQIYRQRNSRGIQKLVARLNKWKTCPWPPEFVLVNSRACALVGMPPPGILVFRVKSRYPWLLPILLG